MADSYFDYNVDPFNSDAPDYINVQSAHFSGAFGNRNAPASPNFPLGTPTRYFLTLPGIIDTSDLAGARPVAIRDVTGAVTLTRVTAAPSTNEYRISPSTSERRNIIELNVSQAGDEIGFDFYMIGSMPSVVLYGQETIKVASSDSTNNGNASKIIQTTDDAGAAITTIISDLNGGNGGTIFFEEGTYNIDTAVALLDDVNLIGQGRGTEFKKGGNVTVLNGANKSNIKIKDININGNKASFTGEGVDLDGGTNITIQGCEVHDCSTTGITAGSDLNVINCDIHANLDGIFIDAFNVTISNCAIYSNTAQGVEFNVDSASDIDGYLIISNNQINNNVDGVRLEGPNFPSVQAVTNITVQGNVIEANTDNGIELLRVKDSTIVGNTIHNNTADGIAATTCDFLTITANSITDNGAIGIDGDDIDDSTIQSNIIFNNTTDGVTLDASSNANFVQSNQTVAGNGASAVTDSGTNNSVQTLY